MEEYVVLLIFFWIFIMLKMALLLQILHIGYDTCAWGATDFQKLFLSLYYVGPSCNQMFNICQYGILLYCEKWLNVQKKPEQTYKKIVWHKWNVYVRSCVPEAIVVKMDIWVIILSFESRKLLAVKRVILNFVHGVPGNWCNILR
jgi:hypothetical protein